MILLKEVDLHTKRTGHADFVDKTLEAAKPIELEAAAKPKDDVVVAAEEGAAAAASKGGQSEGELFNFGFRMVKLSFC